MFTSLPTPTDVEAVGFGEQGLKLADRRLWYVLHSRGFETDGDR